MKPEKLDKVISICDKKLATAEEILDGCAYTCPAQIGFTKKEGKKGYMSCSFTETGKFALCLWQLKEEGKYEKIAHAVLPINSVMSVKGIVDYCVQMIKI